jgi:hypothetical protein
MAQLAKLVANYDKTGTRPYKILASHVAAAHSNKPIKGTRPASEGDVQKFQALVDQERPIHPQAETMRRDESAGFQGSTGTYDRSGLGGDPLRDHLREDREPQYDGSSPESRYRVPGTGMFRPRDQERSGDSMRAVARPSEGPAEQARRRELEGELGNRLGDILSELLYGMTGERFRETAPGEVYERITRVYAGTSFWRIDAPAKTKLVDAILEAERYTRRPESLSASQETPYQRARRLGFI